MRIYLAESPIVEIGALPLPPRLSSCCYHQLCPQLIRSGHLLHPLGRKGTSPNADSGQAEYCTTFTHVCVCLSPAHPGHLDQPDHSDHLDWSKKLSRNWIHLLLNTPILIAKHILKWNKQMISLPAPVPVTMCQSYRLRSFPKMGDGIADLSQSPKPFNLCHFFKKTSHFDLNLIWCHTMLQKDSSCGYIRKFSEKTGRYKRLHWHFICWLPPQLS